MEKCHDIQKYSCSMKDDFSEDCFFKDVLTACHEKKLLDDNVIGKICYERMELLKIKLKYYTKDESSSVTVEVAESILQCIDHTLGIHLKTFDTMEMIMEELKNASLADMLKAGHDSMKKKTLDSRKLLQEIVNNKLQVDNYSYNDTIDHGIPLFFKEYDDFFAAHETPGSIDYQLCIDNMNYTGVEYICNYLKTLSLENEFCHHFDVREINKLLKGYDKNCESLLINIFELVLINSLGLLICDKDLSSLNINSLDRNQIKNKLEELSLEELQEKLLKYANACCEILKIKDAELETYLKRAALKTTSLIFQSIKLDRLETVFISYADDSKEIIEYADGKKMANSEFKKLTEEIRECSSVQDKIHLIKSHIKSLEDLVDMLDAECLFEEEYPLYFKSLSPMEIILLSKYMSEQNLENECEEDWHLEFKRHVLSLSEEDQASIRATTDRIRL